MLNETATTRSRLRFDTKVHLPDGARLAAGAEGAEQLSEEFAAVAGEQVLQRLADVVAQFVLGGDARIDGDARRPLAKFVVVQLIHFRTGEHHFVAGGDAEFRGRWPSRCADDRR